MTTGRQELVIARSGLDTAAAMLPPPPSRAPRRHAWWPGLVLTAATCGIHAKELLGQRPYWRDTMRLYVPFKHFMAETLRGGEWPHWWPYDSAGAPFLANPQFSTFHPSTLAYLVAPFWSAFLFQDLLGTWLALTGMYLLARSLRQARLASLASALVFGAGGYMVSLSEFQFMKLSAGTMPWYLWSLRKAQTQGGSWWVAPPVALGLLLLAGDPQAAILVCFAGLVLSFVDGASWRHTLLALLSPIGGALLAAVQLLPAMGIASETERHNAMAELNDWGLAWGDALAMPLPFDNGAAGFVRATCIGVTGLALIFASLSVLRRRRVWLLWTLVLVGGWLALGDHFGLNWLARRVVPYWASFRFPIKSIVLSFLASGLLAGEGWHALAARRRGALIVSVAATALFSLAAAIEAQNPVVAWVILAVFATATAGVVFLLRRRGPPRVVAAALVVFVSVLTGAFLLKAGAASFYDPPALVSVLQKAGVGLTGPYFDRFDEGINADVEHAFTERAAVGGRSLPFGALWHLPILGFSTPASSWRLLSIFHGGRMSFDTYSRAFGLFGVGFVVITPDLLQSHPLEVLGVDPEFGYRVARLPRSLPRAYAVHRAVGVTDVQTFRQRLVEGRIKPAREVFIEGTVPPDVEARPDMTAAAVTITSRDNTHVSLDAALQWPGYVVLNESAYKGWSVHVDGQPATPLIANGCVRAVEVAAGRHRVDWNYETPFFRLGLKLSLLAWLAAITAALAIRPRRT